MRDKQMDGGKVRRIRPQQAAMDAGRTAEEPSPSRRRGRRSKTGKVQRLQMAMVIVICGCVLAALGVGFYINRITEERKAISREALRLERELSVVAAELEAITLDRDALVNSRIPGLTLVAYDETIQVGKFYVRNIVFTLAMKDETPSYEYRVVFSNDGLSTVIPDVQIILFDELGIQLGEARVPVDDVLTVGELSFTLEPGEVRTHSGAIEFLSKKSPKYFSLQID